MIDLFVVYFAGALSTPLLDETELRQVNRSLFLLCFVVLSQSPGDGRLFWYGGSGDHRLCYSHELFIPLYRQSIIPPPPFLSSVRLTRGTLQAFFRKTYKKPEAVKSKSASKGITAFKKSQ